jgi:hypothetical protein
VGAAADHLYSAVPGLSGSFVEALAPKISLALAGQALSLSVGAGNGDVADAGFFLYEASRGGGRERDWAETLRSSLR